MIDAASKIIHAASKDLEGPLTTSLSMFSSSRTARARTLGPRRRRCTKTTSRRRPSARTAWRALSHLPLAVALLTFSSNAHAQLNAEALRTTLRKNPRFLWLEGSLAGRVGNTQTMTFSGSAFGGLTVYPHLFFMRLAADYGQAQSTTTVARWVAHTRYNYNVSKLVAIEALAQVQHDRFRRLAVRDLYGAGLRFNIINEDEFELFAGTTYLLEHEVLEAVAGVPGSNDVWHRSSNYVGLNARVGPLVDLSSVIYMQPRFDRPADFRVLSESFITFAINQFLSARISTTVWFDNDPPTDVRPYDIEIRNSLVLKLQ